MNLNQITVPSLDLTKAIPFYEKLGLKLIVKSLPHYARFECPNGNSTFSIHLTDKLPMEMEYMFTLNVRILTNMLKKYKVKELNSSKIHPTRCDYGGKRD
ncbi:MULTISPECIES: hypothetical protein [unclassified Algoriphagus]|jgi:hypothetical protein|uniref:hypothetical protein n=1 Tax=unclassified Algoriphagus TaxID=2641541 RepID=UPI00257BDF8E|nr:MULTISPECIES: hypothetical protein [unclassified Algoriphagus]